MSTPVTRLTPSAVPFTIIRFLLLSGEVGLAVGALSMTVMCHRECGGYGEAIYAVAFGATAALVAFVALAAHYAHNFKVNPQSLVRQSKFQWAWLAASIVVCIIVIT